jgi:hypothetical protein
VRHRNWFKTRSTRPDLSFWLQGDEGGESEYVAPVSDLKTALEACARRPRLGALCVVSKFFINLRHHASFAWPLTGEKRGGRQHENVQPIMGVMKKRRG